MWHEKCGCVLDSDRARRFVARARASNEIRVYNGGMAEPLVDAVKLDATSRAASTSASQAAKVANACYTKAEKARKEGEKRMMKPFDTPRADFAHSTANATPYPNAADNAPASSSHFHVGRASCLPAQGVPGLSRPGWKPW